MSVHKETKVRNLIQQRGLLHVGSAKTAETDIGLVGEYTDSGTKYAGLFRSNVDGIWKLFDGLTESPYSGDAVDAGGAAFALGTLEIGELTSDSITSATTNGDLTIDANG